MRGTIVTEISCICASVEVAWIVAQIVLKSKEVTELSQHVCVCIYPTRLLTEQQ